MKEDFCVSFSFIYSTIISRQCKHNRTALIFHTKKQIFFSHYTAGAFKKITKLFNTFTKIRFTNRISFQCPQNRAVFPQFWDYFSVMNIGANEGASDQNEGFFLLFGLFWPIFVSFSLKISMISPHMHIDLG